MAQPSTSPLNSAPSPHNPTPSAGFSGKVNNGKNAVLSILKETDWPKEASNDVQALIQMMEAPLDLDRFPEDETQLPVEVKAVIKPLLRELKDAHAKLKAESEKYGMKKKGFRKDVKKLFSRTDPNQCTEVLRTCQTDLKETLTTVESLLSNLASKTEQRAGQVAENDGGNDSTRRPSPQKQAATMAAVLGPSMSPAQSNTPPASGASAPQATQAASAQSGKRQGSPRRIDLLNSANKTLKLAEGVSGALPVVGGFVGAVAKVGLTMVEMVQAMDTNDETAERLGTHIRRLSSVVERVSNQARQSNRGKTTKGMEDLQRTLGDIQCQIENIQSQASLKKFWRSVDHSGSLKTLQEKIRAALEEIQLLVNLNTSLLVAELHNETIQSKYRHLLDRLGDGKYGARGEIIEDVTCLPGTRVNILGRIDTWIRAGPNSERVLWIRGMAGRGKSTIASTVAHSWKDRARCAIYHFRRGQNISNASLVCALARQLAKSLDPKLRKAILSTVEEKDDIINQRLDEQFAALFTSSLRTLRIKQVPILIVVDALDECDSVDYAVNFVKLIDRHSASLPDNLKFLLTSRPEAPLLRALEPRKWHAESLDSIDDTDTDADIERFLHHSLLRVKAEHEIEGEWPAPADTPRLARMSQGLFQWARTVVKYINEGSPTDQLAELLGSPTVCSGVDELYTQILSKALEKAKQHSAKENLFLSLLGTLVVAPYPVSLEVVAFLHAEHDLIKGKTPETVFNFLRRGILSDLNSLLFIPASSSEPIRLMHTSIRDLLVDRKRCKGQQYWVDLAQNHRRLAAACICQMNRHLRENICNLKDLSKPSSEVQDIVEHKVSKGIQYCCRAWSTHLMEGGRWRESGMVGAGCQEADFRLFSEEKVLYWLEVMSLAGASNEATMMAEQAQEWLSQYVDETSQPLVILWNDVQRFTAAFGEAIAFSPLHIYVSALTHCPVKTELWKYYSNHAKIRTIRGVQPPTWPSDIWTKPVGRTVASVAFSPDGAVLALGYKDGTIHFLDPHTGREIRESLTGHGEAVSSVCFSPDGKVLASASEDSTIRLWDPRTGSQVSEPFQGHNSAVRSVCFSPDGKLLASASRDYTIRLWDPQTGSQVGEPLTGHSDTVWSACFSPDGEVLASGSWDDTIRLWNPRTGSQVIEPLRGHKRAVRSVCFSPDGKLLASASEDNTIRLWDPHTGSQVGEPLTGHSRTIWSVCFSPDGKLLASGCKDKTIRLWDPHTGCQVGEPLTSHSDIVWSVCFSPDGKLLASASEDNTIRLWGPHTGNQVDKPFTGHSDTVQSVCFSPDGKLLATGSRDHTIRLWDSQTGSLVGEPLTGHTDTVRSVCFSPDGKVLASASEDSTIRLWDPRTGSQVSEPFQGHNSAVRSVCFSPDGKLLASASRDYTIRLWDPQTGSQVGEPLTGHSDTVWSACFSPDGEVLASGSWDDTIQLWDPQTGSQVGEPLSYDDWWLYEWFEAVWFSPDGKAIAARDRFRQTAAWDMFTRQRCDVPPFIPPAESLAYIDHWVTFSTSPFFWLPPHYWGRSPIVTLCEGKLAVAHANTISIYDFSDSLGGIMLSSNPPLASNPQTTPSEMTSAEQPQGRQGLPLQSRHIA